MHFLIIKLKKKIDKEPPLVADPLGPCAKLTPRQIDTFAAFCESCNVLHMANTKLGIEFENVKMFETH